MTRRRDGSGMRPVRSLFGDILPEGYGRKTAEIQRFQAFFDSLDDDPVYAYVQVLSVQDGCLTIAVPSPGLVNYLRLHTVELNARIKQQFGHNLTLKMIVQPGGRALGAEKARSQPAQHFSSQVAERVGKSAAGIDDEKLREALMRLAQTIKK
jgi:hypothetical protein